MGKKRPSHKGRESDRKWKMSCMPGSVVKDVYVCWPDRRESKENETAGSSVRMKSKRRRRRESNEGSFICLCQGDSFMMASYT